MNQKKIKQEMVVVPMKLIKVLQEQEEKPFLYFF